MLCISLQRQGLILKQTEMRNWNGHREEEVICSIFFFFNLLSDFVCGQSKFVLSLNCLGFFALTYSNK